MKFATIPSATWTLAASKPVFHGGKLTPIKRIPAFALAASLALIPAPLFARTAPTAGPGTYAPSAWAQTEATHMVPAEATLIDSINAQKMQLGATFKARLNSKIELKNGPTLPSGTILMGKVANDDMNVQGRSKLALRFTQAQLKDGQVVPIKATIVGAYTNADENANGYDNYPLQPPNTWNSKTLVIDQLSVSSGVDLHSRIASNNSGVFVTTSKDNVKLGRGSDLALAIAPGRVAPATSTGAGSAGGA